MTHPVVGQIYQATQTRPATVMADSKPSFRTIASPLFDRYQ